MPLESSRRALRFGAGFADIGGLQKIFLLGSSWINLAIGIVPRLVNCPLYHLNNPQPYNNDYIKDNRFVAIFMQNSIQNLIS